MVIIAWASSQQSSACLSYRAKLRLPPLLLVALIELDEQEPF